MDITFEVDTAQLNQMAVRISNMFNRLPTHLAKAMTYAAYDAQKQLKAETPSFVDRPTKWTLNATFVQRATPESLAVRLGFKDTAVKGTPAARYLQPMVKGGQRGPKSTEWQLQRAGLIRPGQYIVPTGVHPLPFNEYGNVPAAKYTQVLSRLRAFGEQGYSANRSGSARSQARRTGQDYFLGGPGGLKPGIQARVGPRPSDGASSSGTQRRDSKGRFTKKAKKPGRPRTSNLPRGFHTVFYITPKPRYQATFPVRSIIQSKFNERFPSIFERIVFNTK
jgi:hypothetical protein